MLGVGEYQLKKLEKSEKAILEVLKDGKWHRHQEIKEKTRLSTATLSKTLKRLEKGLIEKKIDLESGEYPYPVYYRLKKIVFDKIKPFEPEFTRDFRLIRYDLHFLNELCGFHILAFLKLYFENPEKNEELFNQAIEHFAINRYREAINSLKETLKEQAKKGIDVSTLLTENLEKFRGDYEFMLKAISQKDRKIVQKGEKA